MFTSAPLLGLWRQSIVRCADNTGIIKACIIGLGKNKWGTGAIGHRVRISVRDKVADYKGDQLPKAIIARRRKNTQRKDGSMIKFDENAVVVIKRNKPAGFKIKGPLPYELQSSARNLARWIF
eukprot:gnl/MRDRNA2_/MRDRNA2_109691_c0_seq1.p1 gnl/MRDRNA2_/MRDRNA2_109691_c0~~gnl/MRDRNA2_/MRDRNA2_109691_c0_seq1.p1  ORF type:complete len:123 (+),score=28.83 gnl/MRDRNA2_/MRDRNA2_109691_c0_seq1:82-450(+)